MDFLIGGTAATCAGFFSNPFDVIKTRQQLQGELQKHVKHTKQPYGTQWQAIKTIVKSEGLIGLQKGATFFYFLIYYFVVENVDLSFLFYVSLRPKLGLIPALTFQFVMNSTRLGLYETVDQLNWTRFSPTSPHSTVLCVLWGAASGVAGI